LIDDEGNTSVQFLPPLDRDPVATITSITAGEPERIDSVDPKDTPTEHTQRDTIRTVEQLSQYISRKSTAAEFCSSLLATSFEFNDLFCLCHRSDEGDYFNCDYGLTGCGGWFHSGKALFMFLCAYRYVYTHFSMHLYIY
jgi:hypothetical protein